jgi:hypothetical protein
MTGRDTMAEQRSGTQSTPPGSTPAVEIIGGRRVVIPVETTHQNGTTPVVRTMDLRCRSGAWFSKTWRGLPLLGLLEDAAAPADTTHLVVEADDGHTACVPIGDVLEGLLALERSDGERPTRTDRMPRVVAPGLDGPHAVKNVTRIEAVAFSPEDDPDDVEQFDFESVPSSEGVDDEE